MMETNILGVMMTDKNLKELLEDVVNILRLCMNNVNDPKSPYYCTMMARKIRDAFDACKEAMEKINAS